MVIWIRRRIVVVKMVETVERVEDKMVSEKSTRSCRRRGRATS